uniref:Uncharacterized protein n=1 Tax=Oryza sativa subsp. japonica TaxID=39947 RepID=Q6Z4D9_ORYSJ|nr:hypothetical protein [Oryza sativa Japonica Group]BAD31855.1 hypothetical protein [Oryza sativa Japonica Group]
MGTRRSSFLSKCETLCPRGRQRPSRGYCWGSIFRSQKVANRSAGLRGSRRRDSAGGKKGKAHASFGQRPISSRRAPGDRTTQGTSSPRRLPELRSPEEFLELGRKAPEATARLRSIDGQRESEEPAGGKHASEHSNELSR